MGTILNDLLNLFFPTICLLCREPLIDGEKHICLHCLCDLPHTGYYDLENNPVAQLFFGKIPIVNATALFHYEKGGHVRQLIHALKYHDNRELGIKLGHMFALEYQKTSLFNQVDLLIPVPLHPKKLKQRGYNQSELIARGIGEISNLPVNTTVLGRNKKTETQTNKQVYDRWSNVQHVFSIADYELLQHKHILLVDDVITTGSTIGACAETLSSIPGIRISLLSIAIAR